MRAYDIIRKKRDKETLSHEEIDFLIGGYVRDEIPDYQVSAFLMAVFLNGLSKEELFYFTKSMAESGDMLDLSVIEGVTVDKHSTGGVGDTTTLLVGPILAACGLPFAKMSGRGLGHTGGTVDKLESIPGFNTALEEAELIKQVNEHNLCICGQTANIAPADKLIYALRDVTATVESIPLIASSIMSKKLAIGCDKIILDVKCGEGAFMKDLEDAIELGRLMVEIGTLGGIETIALVTNMEEPLGSSVGNTIEVVEVVEMLKNEKEGPLLELSKVIAETALVMTGKYSEEEAKDTVNAVIQDGSALEAFYTMVDLQGGDSSVLKNTALMPKSKEVLPYRAQKDGWIGSIDALKIGEASLLLGAGRETKEDTIQPEVGVNLFVRVGSEVAKGDIIAELHYNEAERAKYALQAMEKAFVYEDSPTKPQPLIWKKITKNGIFDY